MDSFLGGGSLAPAPRQAARHRASAQSPEDVYLQLFQDGTLSEEEYNKNLENHFAFVSDTATSSSNSDYTKNKSTNKNKNKGKDTAKVKGNAKAKYDGTDTETDASNTSSGNNTPGLESTTKDVTVDMTAAASSRGVPFHVSTELDFLGVNVLVRDCSHELIHQGDVIVRVGGFPTLGSSLDAVQALIQAALAESPTPTGGSSSNNNSSSSSSSSSSRSSSSSSRSSSTNSNPVNSSNATSTLTVRRPRDFYPLSRKASMKFQHDMLRAAKDKARAG
jgi:hypothetical protein